MSTIEVKTFDKSDETRTFEGQGWADFVKVLGKTVAKAHFEPGWKWSRNVKPLVGGDLCQVSHLGYCLEGRMRVIMSDGTEQELTPGEVVAIAPGHDAEVVGDETCVFLDFGEIAEYAKPK